jgi:hypothetical protein
MFRFGLASFVVILLCGFAFAASSAVGNAAEPIELPAPMDSNGVTEMPADQAFSADEWLDGRGYDGQIRIFSAVLETRRFGPVEEPEHQFFALRNGQEPGFPISPPAWGWPGWGFGWGRIGWGGISWGGFGVPNWGFGLVGYNRYFYRPWYSSPNPYTWSDHLPWYAPGGAGPNIYQPWYTNRYSLPWYSPNGIGPNIYTPWYQWQMYYPWYAPNGPGPNIYTPWWRQYGGCFYW